ncbi:6-bladed beta-propeller [bacterium]|nr:6-bladed beta-propeller [bacterium]
MKQKLYLLAVIGLLAFSGGWLYTQFTGNSVPFSAKSVKGLSEGAVYIPNNYVDLGIPENFTILPDNSMWFVDSQNYRVVKVNQSGTILRTLGKQGSEFGEFSEEVQGITADSDGNLYVLDLCHVSKFDYNGGFITSWGICGSGTSDFSFAKGIHYSQSLNQIIVADSDHHRVLRFTKEGTYVSQFGTEGSGNGEFNQPVGITTDSSGRIYVVDSDNHKVQRFNSAGVFDISFGSEGTGDGQFTFPKNAAIDTTNGDIYVTSQNSQKIQIFDSNGVWKSSWGENGSSAWQFLVPKDIKFDSSGNVWVTDFYNKSLQRFTKAGVYMSAIRNGGYVSGRFAQPHSAAYDSTGNLYVLDNGPYDARIQKFTNAGTFVTTIVSAPDIGTASYHMRIRNNKIYATHVGGVKVFDLTGTELLSFGTEGTGNGEFQDARGIDVDSSGNIYVADLFNSRVQKFDSDGNYLLQWGTEGTGNGQFGRADALYIDSSDKIYVSDNPGDSITDNTRVQVFNTAGVYQSTIGSYGNEDNQLQLVTYINEDSDGNLLFSDVRAHKIKIFTPAGTYVSSYGAYGSSIGKFNEPGMAIVNPITGSLTIADQGNHRVQLLPAGTRIYNLSASIDVTTASNDISLVNSYINPANPEADSINSRLYFGNMIVVSDFTVDMTSDRNWESVNATTLVDGAKALVVNLNPTDAPGVSSTHALYIVKQEGQVSVRVCPDATTVEEITLDCTNGYDLVESDPELSTVTIDDVTYWKVTGLTGTGIMSELVDPTPTPTPTATTTPTATATPTTTASTTPTPTATPTTTASTTPTPTGTLIVVDTLAPAPPLSTQACPTFDTFTTSKTIIQKGEKVKVQWQTKNTEAVLSAQDNTSYSPVDSVEIPLETTTTLSFIADNGFCNAKKTTVVQVVDVLPWVTTLSVGTGALLAEAVFALQQPTLFGNIWLSLASFIGRRKRQTWGVIYDSSTKKPLGRAVLRLHRVDNVVVDTVVSEANGTYKLTPKVGVYTISVTHPGYTFPSTAITGDIDGGYANIYKGSQLHITDTEQGILMSIPLDPANLSDKEKSKLKRRSSLTKTIELLSNGLMIGGFMYSLYIALVFPHTYNYLILGLYFVLAFTKVIVLWPKKTSGTVKFENGSPVAGIEIGLFDTEFKNLLYRTFTNEAGQYTFVVPNTTYNLKIMDNRYKILDQGVATSGVQLPESGTSEKVKVINQDLSLVAV